MIGKNLNKSSIKLTGSFAAVVLLILWSIFWRGNDFSPSPKVITVSKGQSFSSLAESLKTNGVISNKFTFTLAGRLLGVTHSMRIGKYNFLSGISNLTILRDIQQGISVVPSKVTIVEGYRNSQIARLLHEEVGVDSISFMSLMDDTSLIGIPNTESTSLEGYLMPDTYDFFWQDDERQIVKELTGEFRKFFVDSLQRRTKQMHMTVNDIMTMASIVEGEAVYDDERPIIAGVYYNRLRIGMRLQADPTVQYAVSEETKRLTKNDLEFDSPYNTYLHYGLPPGPINNPGRQSILAALYPARHHYLYFVSNNNGRHRFSRTYSEHRRNVRAYRKARALAMGQ